MVHPVPDRQREVREDNELTFVAQLIIVLHRPKDSLEQLAMLPDRLIVIAEDEMVDSIQSTQQVDGVIGVFIEREVAKIEHMVIRIDNAVPAPNNLFIHLFNS